MSTHSAENEELTQLDTQLKTHLQKMATSIRVLAMDAVQKADSGHPGLPMGCAELGAYLYSVVLRQNPLDPRWINRDRLILSAGHGSMWLYSCLHLSGFDVTMDDLKQFRQLHSRTPGHPEYGMTPGVETTTGPLGQGLANAVGTALGMKMLAQRWNTNEFSIISPRIFVLVGDGCMMEGISHEASSLAGHLGLDNLVVFYDSNGISLDGLLSESDSDDTKGRFLALGWDVYEMNGNDLDDIHRTVQLALENQTRPVLIITKTVIGKGAPTKAGTNKAHGSPLGEEEVRQTKIALGVTQEPFFVPRTIYEFFSAKNIKEQEAEKSWQRLFERWSHVFPEKRKEFDAMVSNEMPSSLFQGLFDLKVSLGAAGRQSSSEVIQYLANALPQLCGGSADLSCSDLTLIANGGIMAKDHFGARNIKFGVREFAMAAMASGLRETGALVPFVGTFLTFSDYMRNAIRLASLMRVQVIYQFTHDSVFLGEDGPTHQPVEQIASLRAIPHLQVIRPAGSFEVKMAWQAALQYHGPTALVLSRQKVKEVPETYIPFEEGMKKGAYIVRKERRPEIEYTLIATGSELPLACDVADELVRLGKSVRVISMPCWFLFEQQPVSYKEELFGPKAGRKVSIEAAADFGWHKYIGSDGIAISVEDFGLSAPASMIAKELGFTVEDIIERILSD